MSKHAMEHHWRYGHALLLIGFALLVINHLSVVMGHAWLIPSFLRLY
jgi:hypothetical protein